MMRTLISLLVCFAALAPQAWGVEGDSARYLGGNLAGLTQKQEGTLDTSHATLLRFRSAGSTWEVPYKNITKFEYGNKGGRQVGAAVLASTVTLAGPMVLAAPKKKHFVTLQVKDEAGNVQAGVFEVSKTRYMSLVADLEEKTGLKANYEKLSKTPVPPK
jgi:hypothetical protein